MLELVRLAKHPEAKKHSVHLLANAGALAFATGENELGKEFYQRAIRMAQASNEPAMEALARAFFARAAAESGDPQAAAIIEETAKTVERLSSPGAIHVVRELVDPSKREHLEATATGRVAKRKWEWDAASNTLRTFE